MSAESRPDSSLRRAGLLWTGMRVAVSVILLAMIVKSATATVAAQSATVQWTGERLTVRAVNAPLRTLLEDVAQRTGVVVSGADRLAGNHTVDIRNAYLVEALTTLLENVNFIVTRENGQFHLRIHSMTSRPPPTGSISIPALTDRVVARNNDVVPEDEDQKQERADEISELESVVERNSDDSLREIADALQSDYSEVRIRALQMLADRSEEPEAIEEIISAFADDDINVVLTASDLMASIPGRAALEAIESQLLPENEDISQFAALRSLALRGDVSSITAVSRAASEGPATLREPAERLLKALEERARMSRSPGERPD